MPRIKTPCRDCKKPLLRWPAQIKASKYGAFCDRHCLGRFRTTVLVGDLGANFKTGSKADGNYQCVLARWHPYKDKRGYVSLHRLIAEARCGYFLPATYVVHHKDGDPSNNHWNNLEIMTQSTHAKSHMKQDKKTGRITKHDNI